MKKIIILLTITLASLNIAGQIRSLKIDKGDGNYEMLPLNNDDQYFVRTEANANNNLVIKIYDSANNLMGEYPENSKIYPITQTIPVTDISLDKTEITLTDVGEHTTITATIEPSNATNQNLTWTHSGSSITINPNGETCEITAIAEGTATITVTTEDGDHTAECTVTVETFDYGIVMIPVPAGTFTMGSPSGVGENNERPQHQVTLSAFSIGKTEVTQAQWQAVMGSNPAHDHGIGDNYPVYYVSWNAIVGTSGATMEISGMTYYEDGFIYKLNQQTGKHYRLPTEAEWEYAARGGNHWTDNYTYSGSDEIDNVAWYWYNIPTQDSSQPVGTKTANQLGIHDMSGNVYEWCYDWYASYTSDAQTNPTGPTSGSYRMFRGGSWDDDAGSCHVAYRNGYGTDGIFNDVGFRLVLVP